MKKVRGAQVGHGVRRWVLSAAFFLLSGAQSLVAEAPAPGMAYLWHRVRDRETDEALKPFRTWKIYALSAELRRDRPDAVLKPLPGTVPVVRLDRECWRKEGFPKRFLRLLRTLPAGEVQLDCDVPESQLRRYAEFLKELCAAAPEYVFSVTVLPCHLHHPELREVLVQTVYAVLQLHALETPEALPHRYRLFDGAAAERAVRKMRRFGTPFKLALPSYAYTIHYTRDGRFRRMSAENELPLRDDEVRELAQPDWEELLKFRKQHPDLDVIWFRLPRKGDRLALEAANLLRLDRGERPRTEVEVIARKNGAATDLYWHNHGLPGRVSHTMALGGTGEVFFFNGAQPEEDCVPGQVPDSVRGELPPPGETIWIARILHWEKHHD